MVSISRNSTRFDTAASLSSRFSVPSQPIVRPADARLQFHDCFPAPLLYPAVTIVGVKCMLDGARSFNGKVHHLLSRVGRRWMEEGSTNCLLLNTPATTSRSAPDMTGNPRGDKE
jgi:hypothetical protein